MSVPRAFKTDYSQHTDLGGLLYQIGNEYRAVKECALVYIELKKYEKTVGHFETVLDKWPGYIRERILNETICMCSDFNFCVWC